MFEAFLSNLDRRVSVEVGKVKKVFYQTNDNHLPLFVNLRATVWALCCGSTELLPAFRTFQLNHSSIFKVFVFVTYRIDNKKRGLLLISNSRASTPFIPLIYRIAHAEACAITILGRYNFKSVEVFELNPNMQTLVC